MKFVPGHTSCPKPGFEVWDAKHILGGQTTKQLNFKTKLSGQNIIWKDTKNFWGALPTNASRGYVPDPLNN